MTTDGTIFHTTRRTAKTYFLTLIVTTMTCRSTTRCPSIISSRGQWTIAEGALELMATLRSRKADHPEDRKAGSGQKLSRSMLPYHQLAKTVFLCAYDARDYTLSTTKQPRVGEDAPDNQVVTTDTEVIDAGRACERPTEVHQALLDNGTWFP